MASRTLKYDARINFFYMLALCLPVTIACVDVMAVSVAIAPMIIYMLWVTLVMGAIPALGKDSLQAILAQFEPVKNMASVLISNTRNLQISFFIQIFILFAIASSFIGTSLGLYDFLADGLNISKNQTGKIKLLALTFMPPLIIALTQNHLFITALGFAGLMSTILFGLYPVILAWSGRYIHKLDTHYMY